MSTTIAAIATAQAAAGLGTVRLSGENALSIADRVFSAVSGKKLIDENKIIVKLINALTISPLDTEVLDVISNDVPTITYYKDADKTEKYVQSVISRPVNIRENNFIMDGHSFVEWNTKADGSGIAYADGVLFLM